MGKAFKSHYASGVQGDIMIYVNWWVHEYKTPVPRSAIFEELDKKNIGRGTIEQALAALIVKGYIRRANHIFTKRTSYVQLRTL